METDCLTCGTKFVTKPSRLKSGRGKYCSYACRSHQRKNPPIPCPTCQAMFHPNRVHLIYCSRICTPAPNVISNPTVRFWEQVNKISSPNGCWEWIGHRDNAGYGRFSIFRDDKWYVVRAARFAFELATGEPPQPSIVSIHDCDNPACVRLHPKHVSFGSQLANIKDKVQKGRQAKGERVGTAKLTEDDVRNIRKRLHQGEVAYGIAREYNISSSNITAIYHRRTWKHVI